MAQTRFARDPASAAAFLDRVGKELAEASAELRELARGIHPAVLTERGLAPAVAALAARARPFPWTWSSCRRSASRSALEATAYFTVSEALTNVAKYAGASTPPSASRARAGARRGDPRRRRRRRESDGGSGLTGLADRIGAIDGTLTVDSPPGEARSSAPSCRSASAAVEAVAASVAGSNPSP